MPPAFSTRMEMQRARRERHWREQFVVAWSLSNHGLVKPKDFPLQPYIRSSRNFHGSNQRCARDQDHPSFL